MDYEPIMKGEIDEMSIAPNLLDYRRARETFKWKSIYRELDGFDGGGINIAHEVLDRHVKTALFP